MSAPILQALGLAQKNSGTYLGNGEWSKTTDAGLLPSINPSTNEVIAETYASDAGDYETIVKRALAAFAIWRTTPAPRRGEAVRLCGEALRKHKHALGSLVALVIVGARLTGRRLGAPGGPAATGVSKR